ncbi:MAG TPA: anthranilate synthase component I family protein [Tenuifilum sp.]|uniref:anthranilate synthase component I family protein n=1 Tax=Tenuifilum sp. TaxID=2760880 RepID=UPI002B68F4F6|nr:anthranilate synthase component I family protein [Tenuifilum sp.]HQI88090.1 anthranilate synthase component I family protein [Tenuifilum sp.]HRU85774.1 anthranilate synthase component I family protein [Tenuifilum sp.]
MRSKYIHRVSNFDRFAKNLAYEVENTDVGILLRGSDRFTIPETNFTSRFQLAAALGISSACSPNSNHFDELDEFLSAHNDWVFGYFTYDLKNQLEHLQSNNPDGVGLPDMFFFVPRILILVNGEIAEFHYLQQEVSQEEVSDLIDRLEGDLEELDHNVSVVFRSHYSYNDYLNTVSAVKQHIARGDVYELNLCQEFFANNVRITPYVVFNKLYDRSPTPFGAFLRVNDKFLMCASPERYLRRDGDWLFSQPIKGTAPRMESDESDQQEIFRLKTDPKERAENVMIVDLVRNDLSRIAKRGSVRVNELCGIYTFPQVHQMISTVSCELADGLRPTDPFRATFPMGSMTGAPKVRVMELIENFERSKRGLYSGAVGYFMPNGNFDFNVVIRSLLYNRSNGYLSFTVGGAITFKSQPEAEYRECLVKAKAILETLNAQIDAAE